MSYQNNGYRLHAQTCSSLSCRSPTEKLLVEMFSGVSAQFLAVLETLTESWRRPLNQAPPSIVPDLDQETVLDIYQVSVCVCEQY